MCIRVENFIHTIKWFFYKQYALAKAGKPKFSIGDKIIIKNSTPKDYYHKCTIVNSPKISISSQCWIYTCEDKNHGQFNYKEWALEKDDSDKNP